MDLSFIILNYHSEKYLIKCLDSIREHVASLKYEIIIINNDAEELKGDFNNSSVSILNTFSNIGFSKACNLGSKIANGKILFFLNPDTELKNSKLTDFIFLLNNKDTGIVAPSLLTTTGKPQPWSCGRKITPLRTAFENLFGKSDVSFSKKSSIESLAWVSGAALLIRKDLFEKIGGFDENFFMYFEDVDLCQRVSSLGKKILLLTELIIIHHGGGSVDNKNQQKKTLLRLSGLLF